MELCTRFCALFFGLILLMSCFLLFECRKLDGYNFPVYSTKHCPRNETEWNQRSSAINCTEDNGYVCLPNENITELLEFCYTYPFILIQEGICLYLSKQYSIVDSYSCISFSSGCPNSSLVSYHLFKNPQCTSIGNGCFLAEPACQSEISTSYLPDATEKNSLENNKDWVLIGTTCVVFIIICFASVCVLFIKHREGIRNLKIIKDVEKRDEEEEELLPCIPQNQQDIIESCVEGNGKCIKNKDAKKQEEEEHLPLISQNQSDKIESSGEEFLLDQVLIEQWKEDNKYFVETKASKEVENHTNSQNFVVVTGDVGSGKSAIMINIALKYKNKGWTVKQVKTVMDMIDIINSPKFNLQNKYFFVLSDPIGIESFDEMEYDSWKKYEEKIEVCLKKFKIKILMSCRNYILSDERVKGLLKNKPNIVDINNEQNTLSREEKEKIWNTYAVNETISDEKLDAILDTKQYFPLLCKSYFSKQIQQSEILEYFSKPREFYADLIETFKKSCKEKYCALILLVLFNNGLCVEDILESKIYNLALKISGMKKNTAPHEIIGALETLQRLFVRKIGDTYHFFHDFVMEITTFVFGKEYPLQTIYHADIGLLRKRVRLEGINDNSDQFTIYLSDKHIDALGKRLFNDIFGERLLDVVLNPCLRNENVINVFIKELELNPEKLGMLLEKKKIHIDQQAAEQPSASLFLSKLVFIGMKEKISPLNAIIIFCDTSLSIQCLKAIQKIPNYIKDNSLFTSVCCNGSMDLFALFKSNEIREYLSEKWDSLYPIHIASAFNNNEILRELFIIGTDANLKTTNDNFWTPLTLAAGNNAEVNDDNATNTRSKRNDTVQLLLDNKADVNMCMGIGASPLYEACQEGQIEIVKLLLDKKALINVCTENGISPLSIACQKEHENIVQLLLVNEADINLCAKNGSNPLYVACQKGIYNIVQLLLVGGANINLCVDDGASPLYIACQEGHYDIVEHLLSKGANIKICMKNGSSPLYVACQKGLDTIVQLLLENEANINQCIDDDTTPLYIACQEGHDVIVEHLINKGADINLCEKSGASALFIACQNGHNRVVELLVCNGADTNLCMEDGTSPLIKACQFGHNSIVQILLGNSADVNRCMKNNSSPLYIACQNGHKNIAKLLLTNGADTSLRINDGKSPLITSCQKGYHDIVELLLAYGADINLCMDDGRSPLYIACEGGHNNIVKLLLLNGADINSNMKNGRSLLFFACEKGRNDIVKLLLENGAVINQCNENGVSPLSKACHKQNDDIVQYLLKNAADINLCAKNGKSPLYVACEFGCDSIVQILLGNSADVNRCMKNNSSPLYIACQNGHKNIAKLLLTNGADRSLCINDGISSLITSCQKGYHDIVELLLAFGADINLCMDDGRSPLYIACEKGHDKIVKLLLHHRADIKLCLKNKKSPIYVACEKGHHNIVKCLLKNGADIYLCTENETSPFYVACQEGHYDIVELLLSKDADLHLCIKNGASPLIVACQNGHYKIVEHLLDKGAEINRCLESGASPLLIACKEGYDIIVKGLLRRKANINLCMKNGESPLYMACQEGYEKIVTMLLTNKADTNLCLKNSKYSPLYIACENGDMNKNIVKSLLNNGANANICTEDGSCPLHIACQKGYYSIAEILLNNEANINQRKKNGASPLYEASREGHANVVQLLLRKEADINLCIENGISPSDIASQNGHGYVIEMFKKYSAVKKL